MLEPLPVCIDAQRDATWGRKKGVVGVGVRGVDESSAKHLSCTDDTRNINRADARGCCCRLGVLATGSQKSGTDLALKDDEVDGCRRCIQTAFVKGFMLNCNCLFMINE